MQVNATSYYAPADPDGTFDDFSSEYLNWAESPSAPGHPADRCSWADPWNVVSALMRWAS